ncbi:aminotransferase class I/II-fold pyridoxal phosphate-dependent enzyme [Microlunatus soli]|uniref:Arginine/lysine/ornithine decarboxylase n=1 Tax=Microlunatus soli TaxID=630515 RepID=A0A1H1N5U8_9ACTN|nr:aminotransferase class I/II-fold pyridoxal phosphate-dependent enzyme [Microlunatus soli]SDR94238.1 Arginine/lysine/ornithine decarboxylase [Microlunatus soli]
MDQSATPILDAITRIRDEGIQSFALPGHRFGRGVDDRTAAVLPREAYGADVMMAKSAVPDSEGLYAEALGARAAIFSTCGSTTSIHTAVLTLIGPGDKVLVDRNVHKSVVAGLIIAGGVPVWLAPSWDHENQIAHPATRDMVAAALERDPDVKAVIMITPTEYGTGADVAGIAELSHARGLPLLVDEAWGGHFGFHPDPPTEAIAAGADLAVQSLHKAGGGLCQASVILIGGDLIDPVDVRLRLDLMTTTSPAALLFGSIDGWRRQFALDGERLIDKALVRAESVRGRLDKIADITVIDEAIHQTEGVAEWDPLKLSVDVSALGVTGYSAEKWLLDQGRIAVQLSDARRVLLSMTYADEDGDLDAFVDLIERLASDPPTPDTEALPVLPPLGQLELEQVLAPRDAFFSSTEQATDPVGRIAAEMVSPYPPGVPTILPGERINAAVTEYLRAGRRAGMTIPDASDPSLDTFRVVRNG